MMCAYNRINGEPACASPRLRSDVLRKAWGFSGYIVSDCGAVGDIFSGHKVVASMAEAVGTGRESGHGPGLRHGIPLALTQAVEQKLILESEIDTVGEPPAYRALEAGHVRPAGARAVCEDSVLREG